MKKEDIEKAAGDYSGSILGFTDNKSVMEKHKAFADGAGWRINSVWHDASEAPQHSGMSLAFSKDGRAVLCGPNNSGWKTTVKVFHIVRWAYVDDLKPNMEE